MVTVLLPETSPLAAPEGGVKVAVTVWAELIVTVQLPVPVHAPLHPAKVEPEVGTAVNVTSIEALKGAAHVLPQLIPTGVLVIVPVPVPD